ncbi:unnamed protein product [Rotaria socialis]|uniref:Peptidase S1 domain-containing protein n=1 Tax=Rotaria socialis TaxID=392032 RepID=A0A820P104_9BILA|nr:unnamed protein product [Rotaria socialis]CAF3662504.1 unnamed protein product [Rotaria socialis]CAF4399305.1 unnamed protein product [Rotaria socialis]CAF4783711.1 unnamed protein product [Rotaria socialis]CAF4796032.1 unnamed protein product [Rotaria socialis]
MPPTTLTIAARIHEHLESGIEIIEADKIYMHPDLVGSSDGYQSDIAILNLLKSLSIETGPFLKRTCVPYFNGCIDLTQYPLNNTRLTVVGWGGMQQGTNSLSDVHNKQKFLLLAAMIRYVNYYSDTWRADVNARVDVATGYLLSLSTPTPNNRPI